MASTHDLIFLFDVDNTLLDNDRFQSDLRDHLTRFHGPDFCARYWTIFEELRSALGYVDYLGALQRCRDEDLHDPALLQIGAWLLDYPFADRFYPAALDAVRHVRQWAPTVILTDGDGIFQPRKLERSGLRAAFEDRALIYIHKEQELADIERCYPARHYVLIDDKLNILDAVKRAWGDRVTTVFPKQGHYAFDPDILARHRPADIAIDAIADLLRHDLPAFRT